MLLLPRRTFLTPDVAQISKFLFIVVVPSIAKCRVPAFFFCRHVVPIRLCSLYSPNKSAQVFACLFFLWQQGPVCTSGKCFVPPLFLSFFLSFSYEEEGGDGHVQKKGETLTFLTRSLSLTSGQARLPAELKHINKRRKRN